MPAVTLWTAAAGAVRLGDQLDEPRVLARLHAAVAGALASSEPAWIDAAGGPRLAVLRGLLGVHPLTLEDMAAGEAREKCEAYPSYLFVALRGDAAPVYLAIFGHVLLSVRPDDSGALSVHAIVASRAMQTADAPATPDWLAYLILDVLVDAAADQVASLQAEADAVEELALSLGRGEAADLARRIWTGMRRATDLQRAIASRIDALRALASHGERAHQSDAAEPNRPDATPPPVALVRTRTLFYLRDVQDHLDGLRAALAEHAEGLCRAHDNFVAQADVELALAGQRMGASAKHLALVTFAMGMTAGVTAVMGMNVRVPFQHGDPAGGAPPPGSLWPFVGLVTTIAAISVGLFLYGRRARWL